MTYLTLDEVLAVHEKMLLIGGGREGVHDFTLLHSAIERPKASFAGKSLYPTIWLKAAALIHSLIKNHPFEDGNKRTAYFSTMRFLRNNGYEVVASSKEVVNFAVRIDIKNLKLTEIARWFKSHSKNL
ncbi:type II toxin-antitoxin system death-on-curing family toxin [Candidatus Gottesmanbacteria bacterium]|nr:type II toxin-antitoxin system death-on-curing family toxin [Candidatus Gottesmanbacteria bacterium]MBI5465208.1 type II toxin-antitoxin system death-on-curing family toxin [Candidatus Gottesmanbacteria bacterium]